MVKKNSIAKVLRGTRPNSWSRAKNATFLVVEEMAVHRGRKDMLRHMYNLLPAHEQEFVRAPNESVATTLRSVHAQHPIPNEPEFLDLVSQGRDVYANTIARHLKHRHTAHVTKPIIDQQKIVKAVHGTRFAKLPPDIIRDISEYTAGSGLRPHQVKGSKSAKIYMARLRAMRKHN
jgi:hypothetical protein